MSSSSPIRKRPKNIASFNRDRHLKILIGGPGEKLRVPYHIKEKALCLNRTTDSSFTNFSNIPGIKMGMSPFFYEQKKMRNIYSPVRSNRGIEKEFAKMTGRSPRAGKMSLGLWRWGL